jgi:hypothetical protein
VKRAVPRKERKRYLYPTLFSHTSGFFSIFFVTTVVVCRNKIKNIYTYITVLNFTAVFINDLIF